MTDAHKTTISQRLWARVPRPVVGWLRRNWRTPDFDTPFQCSFKRRAKNGEGWLMADAVNITGQPAFGDPVGPWIATFAWMPRFTFDGGSVWLRRVWKSHIYKHQYLGGEKPDFWWQYRRFEP